MTAVTKMREPQNGCGASNSKLLIETCSRIWTFPEWLAALEQGDHDRRLARVARDFDKAIRQARAQDFEVALAQRANRARGAYKSERRRLARLVAA